MKIKPFFFPKKHVGFCFFLFFDQILIRQAILYSNTANLSTGESEALTSFLADYRAYSLKLVEVG